MFDNILFILVTCSLEEKRAEILNQVSNNLLNINKEYKIFKNLIVFDNASTVNSTIDSLRNYPNVYQSSTNIGYWSALNWCLDEQNKLLNRDFKYVYIIESDMVHFDFWKLREAVSYLEENEDVGSVRTQKFSVAFRHFFSKGSIFSKFTHDAINLISFPSGEKCWFEKTDYKHIFRSNIHGKLIGLNRMTNLQKIFAKLRNKDHVSEEDFFVLAQKNYKFNGVINGGIFTERLASRLKRGKVPMGSQNILKFNVITDYNTTRRDKIITSGFKVTTL